MTTEDRVLDALLDEARSEEMTAEEMERQRRSFAYGNSKFENERISRQSIETEAERLTTEQHNDQTGNSE